MFALSFQNVLVLLLLCVPAFVVVKKKLIDGESLSKVLSVILLYVCTPFIIISAFLKTQFSLELAVNLVVIFVFTCVFMVVLAGISHLIFRKKDVKRKGVLVFASAFGNVGFMCIPFLNMITDGDPLIILFASVSLVAFNLITWTLGCFCITGEKKYVSIKKALFNLPTLTFLIILPFFVMNVNIQQYAFLEYLNTFATQFSQMVGPLSMSILGAKIASLHLKDFRDLDIYWVAIIKLIISPLLAFLLLKIFGLLLDMSDLTINIIALSAMPAANNVMMFCSLYNKDGEVAAKSVFISTLLSIVTVPLAILLLL